MTLPKLTLASHQDRKVLEGHLWVFSNQIEQKEGNPQPGGLADIYSHRKKFLGRGFYNPHSLIAARILTRQEEKIDSGFFEKRLRSALRLRETLYPGEASYRLAFGESDGMPGLVIDRFEDCFAIQSHCLGMDMLTPSIVEALKKVCKPGSILLKNDSSLRALEGLKEETRVLEGPSEFPIQIGQKLGGEILRFYVDPMGGQKTGFFFDQRENRERLAAYCKGKRVLDCYAYSGGFGLYAAKAGAAEVVSVDSSPAAAELLEKNFQANGLQASVLREDAEEALARLRGEKRKFDIIVLDPPALAKSKKNLFGAIRKYGKLNELALALLDRDGILFSCSCSHHVGKSEFTALLNQAGADAGRTLRLLELRGASRDHPVLPAMPETEYLKCAVLQSD